MAGETVTTGSSFGKFGGKNLQKLIRKTNYIYSIIIIIKGNY